MNRFIALITFLLVSTSVYANEWRSTLNRDHPLTGSIYNLSSLEPVTEDVLLQSLNSAPVVLIGEKHDNADHHVIEARILNTLLSGAGNASVIYEMLTVAQQPDMAVLSPQDDSESLKSKLNWNDRSWPWKHYGPVVETTVKNNATLLAGNITKEQIRTIYRQGRDAIQADEKLHTALNINAGVRDQLLDTVYTEHCMMMPKSKLAPMVDIQLARDAYMASVISTSAETGKTVLIAGGYHVRKDSAVPLHLKQLKPELKPLVVILAEVNPEISDIPAYMLSLRDIADYVWFTPRSTDRDYCEDLKPAHKK